MMGPKLSVTYQFRGIPAILSKKGNIRRWAKAIIADEMQAMADYWHDKILPKHFTHMAYSRYGFKRRSRNYTRRKRSDTPMVFTGRMKKELTTAAEIRRTRGGVQLKMRTARALNFSGYLAYPDMRKEVTATNQQENVSLARRLDRRLQRKLTVEADRRTATKKPRS